MTALQHQAGTVGPASQEQRLRELRYARENLPAWAWLRYRASWVPDWLGAVLDAEIARLADPLVFIRLDDGRYRVGRGERVQLLSCDLMGLRAAHRALQLGRVRVEAFSRGAHADISVRKAIRHAAAWLELRRENDLAALLRRISVCSGFVDARDVLRHGTLITSEQLDTVNEHRDRGAPASD